jgi:hypothetical protein
MARKLVVDFSIPPGWKELHVEGNLVSLDVALK